MKYRYLLFLAALLLLAGCSSSPATPTPTPTQDIRFFGILVCEECPDGMVDIWETPTRSLFVTSFPNGTACKVIGTTFLDGDLFYKVDVEGVTGWVDDEYVQEQ